MKQETYKLFLQVEQGNLTPEQAQIELLELINTNHDSDSKTYKGDEMLKCVSGIYEVYWKSGRSSLAAIGITHTGNRWLAPTNWTSNDNGDPTGKIHEHLDSIDWITLIKKK